MDCLQPDGGSLSTGSAGRGMLRRRTRVAGGGSMKPGDLLIGLRELFAFVVPGVAFLLLLPRAVQEWVADAYGGTPLLPGDETVRLLMFLFAAYAVGAIMSAIGALFDKAAERLVDAARILPWRRRAWEEEQVLQELAAALQQRALAQLPDTGVSVPWGKRAFWWIWLRIHCPACVTEIDRLEAQQKLFRSLMVAGLLLAAVHGVTYRLAGDPASPALPITLFLLLAVISAALYAGLRRLLTRRLLQSAVLQFVPNTLGCAAAGDQPPERRQL